MALIRFSARTSAPWLRITPDAGLVGPDRNLTIDADWPRIPAGHHDAWIDLRGEGGSRVRVALTILQPADADVTRGFVESEGRIVIEAAHYDHAEPAGRVCFGRGLICRAL